MSRNMFRRIEVAWPVRDAALRQRVIDEAWCPTCTTRDAWELDADGQLPRVADRPGPSAQQALMRALRPDRWPERPWT
jgi:polyphosphate kinase